MVAGQSGGSVNEVIVPLDKGGAGEILCLTEVSQGGED